MAAPRAQIGNLLAMFFKGGRLERGQVGFDHIIKDYGDRGTTCGFLPHWMLWRMGCTDAKLIQRFEPDGVSNITTSDDDFTFRTGTGISSIASHAAFSTKGGFPSASDVAKALFSGTVTLRSGDIVIIKGADFLFNGQLAGSEHVFVVAQTPSVTSEKFELRVFQAGQGNSPETQFGNVATLTFAKHDAPFQIGQNTVSGPVARTDGPLGPRAIIGFLDVDKLSFGSMRGGFGLDMLSTLSDLPTNVSIERKIHGGVANEVGSVWNVDFGGFPWLYVFYKGHRVFYVHPKATWRFAGSGAWFAQQSGLLLVWDSGTMENWTAMDGLFAEGVSATGVAVSAQRLIGKDFRTILNSFKNGIGMPVF